MFFANLKDYTFIELNKQVYDTGGLALHYARKANETGADCRTLITQDELFKLQVKTPAPVDIPQFLKSACLEAKDARYLIRSLENLNQVLEDYFIGYEIGERLAGAELENFIAEAEETKASLTQESHAESNS